MSLLNNILSSIDPTARPQSPASGPRQSQAAPGVPKPTPRPASAVNGANGTPQNQTLKRKASGQADGGQIKMQRSGTAPLARPNSTGASRPAPTPDAVKAKPSTSSIPYRGTAGIGASATAKPSAAIVRKPVSAVSTSAPPSKSTTPVPKTPGVAPVPGAAPVAAKKGSYMAMLQAAKEKEKVKPPAPPIKHEVTKILTKKERLALREEAKGKKSGLSGPTGLTPQAGPARAGGPKGDIKEKRKPAELGYTGTARPAKKPADIGYKGTMRPSGPAPGPVGKSAAAAAAAKAKAKKPAAGRYEGYKNWSDLEDEDEDEEEEEPDYYSDASSDMEGGMWDVEKEELLASRIAKEEDAKALAEENELKRQKEERKRKLMAMNKAAAGKRKY